MIGSWV